MCEKELKSIIAKYKNFSAMWLFAFVLFMLFIEWLTTYLAIQQKHELGLEFTGTSDVNYSWAPIIPAMFIILHLCFYSFEKILLELQQEKK